jgi:hypothetical protein
MRRVQVPFGKELGTADREKWTKPKWFFHFSDGVSPGRPDDIRPYRPSGRIFHAMHEISGLKNYLRRDRKITGSSPQNNYPPPVVIVSGAPAADLLF